MIKVFKWLWNKAEKHGREQVITELRALREYHYLKAQISLLERKYEPDTGERGTYKNYLPPKHHEAIAGELGIILERYYVRYERGKKSDRL